MKAVRIFNPLHVFGNKISVSDIEGLTILKLSEHPQIILQIEVKDGKGKDTFDISDWWKANCAKLPAFTYVLRVVLTNSPNSYPPECFSVSIFNSTFDDDQNLNCLTEYMQLSMQSQFDKQPLK